MARVPESRRVEICIGANFCTTPPRIIRSLGNDPRRIVGGILHCSLVVVATSLFLS